MNKDKIQKHSDSKTQNDLRLPKRQKLELSTSESEKITIDAMNEVSIAKKEINLSNNLKSQKPEVDTVKIFDQFNRKLALAKRLNARPCLALDIDNDKISYIKLKKSGKNIQIEKCGIQTLDPGIDRFKAIQLTLTDIESRVYKHGMKVYVSFFSPDINIRQIIIPKTKKKSNLERAVFYKNQTDLPNFDKQSVWNYQVLEEFTEEGVKKLRILVTVVPGEVARMYMEILIGAGLGPEELLPRPLAVATAYNTMVQEPANDLVVVVSTVFTQIYYFRKGKLQFFRNVAMGVSNIEKAIEEKNDGSLAINDEIKKLARRKEAGREKNISNLIKERLFNKIKQSKAEPNSVIKMLHAEINKSMEFVNKLLPDEKIRRIYLSGSGIQSKELVNYLQEQSGDSIVLLRPQFSTSEGYANRYSEYFTALGTSLQTGAEFNIIPAQYRSSQTFKNINILLLTLLFLSIGVAFSLSYYQRYDYIRTQNTLAQLGQQYKILNPVQTKYDQTVLKYGGVNKEINELLSFVKRTPELLGVLRLFSNETPPFIILNELDFNEYQPSKNSQKSTGKIIPNYKYRITLAGQIKSDFQMGDVVLINFMNHLQDLNYFKEIKLTNKRKELNRDLFEFWLELLL